MTGAISTDFSMVKVFNYFNQSSCDGQIASYRNELGRHPIKAIPGIIVAAITTRVAQLAYLVLELATLPIALGIDMTINRPPARDFANSVLISLLYMRTVALGFLHQTLSVLVPEVVNTSRSITRAWLRNSIIQLPSSVPLPAEGIQLNNLLTANNFQGVKSFFSDDDRIMNLDQLFLGMLPNTPATLYAGALYYHHLQNAMNKALCAVPHDNVAIEGNFFERIELLTARMRIIASSLPKPQYDTFLQTGTALSPKLGELINEFHLNVRYTINPQHLDQRVAVLDIPPKPEGVQLNELLEWFDAYQDYLPNYYSSLAAIKGFVEKIRDRVAFIGTPPAGTNAFTEFYDRIENALCHVINTLAAKRRSYRKVIAIRKIFLILADASSHCGIRMHNDSIQLYQEFVLNLDTSGKQTLLNWLAEYRLLLAHTLPPNGHHESIIYFEKMMYALGADLALPGQKVLRAEDPDRWSSYANQFSPERDRIRFFGRYTPAAIMGNFMQLDIDAAAELCVSNVPPAWRLTIDAVQKRVQSLKTAGASLDAIFAELEVRYGIYRDSGKPVSQETLDEMIAAFHPTDFEGALRMVRAEQGRHTPPQQIYAQLQRDFGIAASPNARANNTIEQVINTERGNQYFIQECLVDVHCPIKQRRIKPSAIIAILQSSQVLTPA